MRTLLFFVTIFTTVFLIGCGDGGLATVGVSGTVTYNGEPVANASITFTPKTQGVGHPGYGTTDEKGVYLLQTSQGKADAGTTPGDYLVAIRKVEVDPNAPPPAPGYPAQTRSVIPTRYAQTGTSELTATVENKRSNVFDFALTDD